MALKLALPATAVVTRTIADNTILSATRRHLFENFAESERMRRMLSHTTTAPMSRMSMGKTTYSKSKKHLSFQFGETAQ
jgi:hypothetical protein